MAGAGASPFARRDRGPLLTRLAPVTGELPGYRPPTAGRDLLAAVTVAAVAVPAAMGYAQVAGVSPVNGLYALLLPTVAYAVLGSSRQLAVGPDGSISALVGALVVGMTAAGSPQATRLAAMLALLVAGCFAIARLARLGWIADYLSRPVLVGYLHGVVVVLVVGQLGNLFGVHVGAGDPVPQLVHLVRNLGETSGPTLAVGAVALALLLALRRVAPRFPGPLVVVAGGIAASALAGLEGHGVAVVGSIPSGLPHVELPSPSLADTVAMAPTAVALFLLTFADGVLVARSFAGRHDQHVDAGQELLALGAANAAAGLSQGFPVGASNSRTAVNDAAGVRTQVAGLLAAAVVALILLFLTGPIANLPAAVLAAVIIAAATGLVDVGAWRELARNDHVELAIAAVTTAGVIVTGVLSAIAFAVGLSLIDVVRRSARPHDAVLGWAPELGRYADVSVHRDALVQPGVLVYRLDDRLFFANAGYVKARVREAIRGAATPTRLLVFDAEGVNHIDVAGLDALRELDTGLARDSITLVVARAKTPLEERLREAGLALPLYPTVSAAAASCAEHVSGGTSPRAPSR